MSNTKSNRDDFSAATKLNLSKRVGTLCSNPTCLRHTTGPHTLHEKSISIGKAAHITAAAIGGARYNPLLSKAERQSIANGIWLCSNCADLIDKDELRYPVHLLNSWKEVAEYKMLNNLQTIPSISQINKTPFLEVDFSWTGSLRSPLGLSNKNPLYYEEGHMPMMKFGAGFPPPIKWWKLRWDFSIAIHNNTSFAAINVKIEKIGEINLSEIEEMDKINNIKPFESKELKAKYYQVVEGIFKEADSILSFEIPEKLEGMELLITYLDEDRIEHRTIAKIENNEIINRKS